MRDNRSEILPPREWVSVAVDTGSGYGRGVFRGVSRYALAHTRWQVLPETPAELERQLRAAQGRAGVILQSNDPSREAFFQDGGLAVVNVSNYLRETRFPRVANDDEAVGRMGARYFLERGFREAAWCGAPEITLSTDRQRGFVRAFEAEGGRVSTMDYDRKTPPDAVRNWLLSLPRPCALMAFSDQRARVVLRMAQEAELRVPEDLAVLGVDNDEMSAWAHPLGLSSVQTDGERVGQIAAHTLRALLRGEDVPAEQRVPPIELHSRGSTDLLAIGDPALARALQLIRARACEGLQVDEVARHAGVSRRVLELRFRDKLGRTVLGEIIRQRLALAARLLRETDLSVEEIAGRVGYAETRQLSSAFHHAMGCPPRVYRKRSRGGEA